ncbi:hypothetical protein ACFQT0_31045 [Hymenobacter humi]|uniref:Uncharacterized protein n=1 Tax=Hymenobacter humi TaxID=1411620 RepID=A0ABW2UGG1_9BACT
MIQVLNDGVGMDALAGPVQPLKVKGTRVANVANFIRGLALDAKETVPGGPVLGSLGSEGNDGVGTGLFEGMLS